jgi:hypothetical protein
VDHNGGGGLPVCHGSVARTGGAVVGVGHWASFSSPFLAVGASGERGGGGRGEPHHNDGRWRGDETWPGDEREQRRQNELWWQGLTGADGAICVA